MESKWSGKKSEALSMRTNGQSLSYIHKELGIPKSTLSYWFKNITLNKEQILVLQNKWREGLIKARKGAVLWHNQAKENNIAMAEAAGQRTLNQIDTQNTNITELALALLYLGEGTKAKNETGMGSSDPLILKFFISCLRNIYNVPEAKIRCELHLRFDQDPDLMLDYWSKELNISKDNFNKTYLDKRTAESKTFDSYKGVCLIRCGTVAIQRKLVYIAKNFCTTISSKNI